MGSGYTYYPTSHYAALDAQKVALAKDKGITLIVIPCWWDGTQERYLPHTAAPPHLHTSSLYFFNMQFNGYHRKGATRIAIREFA